VKFVLGDGKSYLEIWQKPSKNSVYAIGADVAEGKTNPEASDLDAHSAHVGDVVQRRIVAKLSGRFPIESFGQQLALLGWYYNRALIGPEVNNTMGGAIREILKKLYYPNIYRKQKYTKSGPVFTEDLGWTTDKVTRSIMISDLGQVIRSRTLYIPAAQTIHQLMTFIWEKNKPQAHPGEYDDDVMSVGITLQMMINALGQDCLAFYVASSQEKQAEPRPDVNSPMVLDKEGEFQINNLAQVGAVDTCEDIYEDDYDDENL